MKNKLLVLLSVLIMVGCEQPTNNTPAPPVPYGDFKISGLTSADFDINSYKEYQIKSGKLTSTAGIEILNTGEGWAKVKVGSTSGTSGWIDLPYTLPAGVFRIDVQFEYAPKYWNLTGSNLYLYTTVLF